MCSCLRLHIANKLYEVSLTLLYSFGREMRIKLAALQAIAKYTCEFVLAHCKNLLQDQRILQCCKIKFCKNERCHLKLIKEILQHFLQCTTYFHCTRNWRLLSKMPKLFAEDVFLLLDFANNTLVNQRNSFYFYAIKQIMQ